AAESDVTTNRPPPQERTKLAVGAPLPRRGGRGTTRQPHARSFSARSSLLSVPSSASPDLIRGLTRGPSRTVRAPCARIWVAGSGPDLIRGPATADGEGCGRCPTHQVIPAQAGTSVAPHEQRSPLAGMTRYFAAAG